MSLSSRKHKRPSADPQRSPMIPRKSRELSAANGGDQQVQVPLSPPHPVRMNSITNGFENELESKDGEDARYDMHPFSFDHFDDPQHFGDPQNNVLSLHPNHPSSPTAASSRTPLSPKSDGGVMRAPMDEYGQLLDPSKVGIVELYEKHRQMMSPNSVSTPSPLRSVRPSLLPSDVVLKKQPRIRPDGSLSELPSDDVHILLHVKHCIFTVGEDTELYFSLFAGKNATAVSEEYTLKLSALGAPSSGIDSRTHCLFRGLSAQDLESDLYIVCRIYRMGSLIWSENVAKKKAKAAQRGGSASGGASGRGVRRPYGVAVLPISNSETISNLLKCEEFSPPNIDIFLPSYENDFHRLPEIIIKNSSSLDKAPKSMGIATGLKLYWGELEDFMPQVDEREQLGICNRFNVDHRVGEPCHKVYVTLGEGEFAQGRKTAAKNIQVNLQFRTQSDRPEADAITRGVGPMAPKMSEWKSTVYYHNNSPKLQETVVCSLPDDRHAALNSHIYLEFSHVSRKSEHEDPTPFAFGFFPLFNPQTGAAMADETYAIPCYKYTKQSEIAHYMESSAFGRGSTKLEKLLTKQTFSFKISLRSTKATQDTELHQLLTWKSLPPGRLSQILDNVMRKPTYDIAALFQEIMTTLFSILSSKGDKKVHRKVYSVLVSILADLSHTAKHYVPFLIHYIDTDFNFPHVHVALMEFFNFYLEWMNTEATEKPSAEFKTLSHSIKGMRFIFQFILKSFEQNMRLKKPTTSREYFFSFLDRIFQGINRMMSRSDPPWVIAIHGFCVKHYVSIVDYLIGMYGSQEIAVIVCSFIESVSVEKSNINVDKLSIVRNFLNHPSISKGDVLTISLPVITRQLKIHISRTLEEQVLCVFTLGDMITLLGEEFLYKDYDPRYERFSVANRLSVVKREATPRNADPEQKQRDADARETLLVEIAGLIPYIFETLDVVRETPAHTVEKAASVISRNMGVFDYMEIKRSIAVCLCSLLELLIDEPDQDPQQHNASRPPGADPNTTVLVSGSPSYRKFSYSARFDSAMGALQHYADGAHAHALKTCMAVCTHLVRESMFPPDWTQLRMLEIAACVRILRWCSRRLTQHNLADLSVWESFVTLAINLLRCNDLRLEKMNDRKRTVVQRRYGDLRVLAAHELRSVWKQMGRERHLAFIERMVEPAIIFAQSMIPQIQQLGENMYFDMLQAEYEQTQTFERVEYFTIDTVDVLTSQYGELRTTLDSYMGFFTHNLASRLDKHPHLLEAGKVFISALGQLFSHLIALKSLPQTRNYEDERTSATLQLMAYLKQTNKNDMYVRYMNYLANLHKDLGNHVEQGLALLFHRNTLSWSRKTLDAYGTDLPRESEWRRNIRLCRLAIAAFDAGDCWERSISICQELAVIFETKLYDIPALSNILINQADYWRKIIDTDRIFQTYYRVGFYGKPFPRDIRGQIFVYRSGKGSQHESVAEFTNRLKEKFPGARVVNSSEQVSDDIAKSQNEDQYIQITTLTPSNESEMTLKQGKEWKDVKANPRLVAYHINNDVQFFSFVRSSKKVAGKSGDEHGDRWVEKTYVVAEEQFPCLRRRVPVIEERVHLISPIEFAVISLVDKTQSIKELISKVQELQSDLAEVPKKEKVENREARVDIGPLSLQLQGVIDAAVQGGIKHYQKAFFTGDYFIKNPNLEHFADKFRVALRDQFRHVKRGLELYDKHCPDELRPHYNHLRECYDKNYIDCTQSGLIEIDSEKPPPQTPV